MKLPLDCKSSKNSLQVFSVAIFAKIGYKLSQSSIRCVFLLSVLSSDRDNQFFEDNPTLSKNDCPNDNVCFLELLLNIFNLFNFKSAYFRILTKSFVNFEVIFHLFRNRRFGYSEKNHINLTNVLYFNGHFILAPTPQPAAQLQWSQLLQQNYRLICDKFGGTSMALYFLPREHFTLLPVILGSFVFPAASHQFSQTNCRNKMMLPLSTL